jgi:Fur family transcriptional regulator, ferric uptake regulator
VTVAPDSKRLAFDDLEQAIRALRASGLRLSTSRRLVLAALFKAAGPVSAEALAGSLSVELTSVYRNLEALERHGLVRHVHLGHGPGLYTLVGEGEREYLYCERCGATRALDPAQLNPVRDRICEQFGYRARFTHFPIVGTCPDCARVDAPTR